MVAKTCNDVKSDSCTGCGLCSNICPKSAIKMVEGDDGFFYPRISSDLCIECGVCYTFCPLILANKEEIGRTPIVNCYYGYNKDVDVLNNSSSGGIFNALAQQVLKKNGIVFGAAFDYKSVTLRHTSTDDVELKQLQGSKYVQSEIGLTYQAVRKALQNNRNVLFVGTPCQCAGLMSFLKQKKYNNLLVCDFICHGVPSARLLKEHLKYLGIRREIDEIRFRPKEISWVDYIKIVRKGRVIYKNKWEYDPYFCLFEHAITLRSSCYNCVYTYGYRKADITIADFWGYRKLNEDIYNTKGLSMIISYSQAGEKAIKGLILEGHNVTKMETSMCEYAFKGSNKDIKKRNEFYKMLSKVGYKKTVRQFGFDRLKSSLLYFIFLAKIFIRKLFYRTNG